MDNTKTGQLIKELRKGKGMTQKELAALLHITDRAVSKWERGLCAPDIALLEPLAGILGCSVLDLIAGERETQVERSEETEEGAKSMIDYSMNEIARKLKRTKKNYLRVTVLCIALLLAICVGIFWKNGYFFVVDKTTSPDETKKVTIYNKALEGAGFSLEDATSLILQEEDGAQTRIIYGDCVYRGLWWAPDSKKYVLALEYEDGLHFVLDWLERHSSSNLSAYLTMGVSATELAKKGYGYVDEGGWPEITYQFLQWGLDSESMLIYYVFEDAKHEIHDGYFWYNCMDGTVNAVLELNA